MDKVWLVTGSASGLGRNIAEAVLESGDRLVATARDPRRLDDLVNQFGERVRAVALDVADESAAQDAVQVALDVFGRLDVVVNNAGFGDFAPFEQLSSERFKAVIDTNFYGVVNVTRAALPIMRKQKSGCILQIASVGGRLGVPGNSPYHAAKWAVECKSETISFILLNQREKHEGDKVREFYSELPRPALVGIEATGSMQWFLNLMEELGIECRVGHPAQIRAAEPRKQKHDRRDADLILKLLAESRSAGTATAPSSVGAHAHTHTKRAASHRLGQWFTARSKSLELR